MGNQTLRSADGHPYRDLNGNGKLDPYEDSRLSTGERIDDLLSQMDLSEKAGMMFQSIIDITADGKVAEEPTFTTAWAHRDALEKIKLNHFNILAITDVGLAVKWHNAMQEAAAGTRLGIPITFSTDPRHAFTQNIGAALAATVLSQWCENLGLAALRDPAAVRQFAEIARQEYIALGIRAALHPTIDLATEPRWARQFNTWGQDADITTAFIKPYLEGFQNMGSLGKKSVALMAKHFPGGGSQKDGEDPHFPYGREQVYPSENFEEHLKPFKEAIKLGVAGMMPYYSIPSGLNLKGEAVEEVGFAFNRQIIDDLLRKELGFQGVVCADWGIITAQKTRRHSSDARAWGVEHLQPVERIAKAINAGVDQFGGEYCPDLVIDALEKGLITEERLNQSVRRLLKPKFELGLFDDPYVNEEHALKIVGCDEFRKAGSDAQSKSITILTNKPLGTGSPTLPFKAKIELYAPDMDADIVSKYATPVQSVEEADLALLRLEAPWEPRSRYFLEDRYHAGSLEFPKDQLDKILSTCHKCPTVIDIYLDRPAIMTEIAAAASAVVVNYGASDEALLSVLSGKVSPRGRLPFEMPSSMEAVRNSPEDRAGSKDPLFPFGHGLSV